MNTPPKADLILHPIRGRLLATLARREMTTREMAREIPDVSQASVYRHVTLLANAGILKVVREVPNRGLVERVYAFDPEDIYLNMDHLSDSTPEDFLRYFKSFLDAVSGQYHRYCIRPDARPQKDGVAFWGEVLYLTPAERLATLKALEDATQPFRDNAPTPERERFYIGRIFIPGRMNPETIQTTNKNKTDRTRRTRKGK